MSNVVQCVASHCRKHSLHAHVDLICRLWRTLHELRICFGAFLLAVRQALLAGLLLVALGLGAFVHALAIQW